ncbi:integrase, partial [Pseudomonas syringae pv. tagetis]
MNLAFLLGADLGLKVLVVTSESFAGFLDHYEANVLPPRELPKGTHQQNAVHFRRNRKTFEGKAED